MAGMSLRTSIRAVACLFWLHAVGCGSDVTTGGGGGGGEGGSPGASCEDFRDTTPGDPDRSITVRIHNETGAPFFLGDLSPACSGFRGFTLTDEAGASVKPDLDICEFTCSSMLDMGCGCPAFCASPEVIYVEPGAVWTTTWTEAIFPTQDMPASCYFEQACEGNGCFDRQAPTEPLVFHAQAFDELGDCVDGCVCVPNDEGWCVLEGATMTAGTPAEASTTWTLTEDAVEIVFQ